MNQYTHRYSLTAADMDTRYRMTPNALLPNHTNEPVYHYLHTIARNDAETAAQVYSEWIPRTEQIDVSAHASRK